MKLTRREFGVLAGAVGVGAASAKVSFASGGGKVVVIGGGAGGATVARYLKKDAPELDITLVEVQKQYTTCFYSNLYLGGYRTLDSITHSYSKLSDEYGVNVVHALATGVDGNAKTVTLETGDVLSYDKLVLSPGIDFRWDLIEGYGPEAAQVMPHAYKAGVQTQILKQQLEAMPAGGTVVIAPPPNPFRCPPGPYERGCMIANYLQKNKPGSKLLILDSKDKHSKMALFQDAYNNIYGDIVEWVAAEFTDGGVKSVNTADMTVTTGDGEVTKVDVANIIPGQKAGLIAEIAGCTNDSGWCPIVPETFESRLVPDVHVLGDASIAAAMPKSGFSANSQAKVVANAVRASLTGSKAFPPRFRNTCWSLISDDNGVKVGASYKAGEEKVEKVDGFISKVGEDDAVREQTFAEANGWYDAITADMFG
jgi:sulfide dehydrogenase [flavocytochrome c] flavoprotein chain